MFFKSITFLVISIVFHIARANTTESAYNTTTLDYYETTDIQNTTTEWYETTSELDLYEITLLYNLTNIATTEIWETFETTSFTSTLTQQPTTTLGIFYRPGIKFELSLELACTNSSCNEFLCANETNFMSVQDSLNKFLCTKFSSLDCKVSIDAKTCHQRMFYKRLFYDLNLKPADKNDLNEIKSQFYNYTNELARNSSQWNEEYTLVVSNSFITIDFSTAASSFGSAYFSLDMSDGCNSLQCDNENFVAVCSDSFICKHKCDFGDYCMNRGECVQSLDYQPKCL
jgi:hypothetical protein